MRERRRQRRSRFSFEFASKVMLRWGSPSRITDGQSWTGSQGRGRGRQDKGWVSRPQPICCLHISFLGDTRRSWETNCLPRLSRCGSCRPIDQRASFHVASRQLDSQYVNESALSARLIGGGAAMKLPSLFLAAIIAVGGLAVPVAPALSHPGGLNGEGCHNNRKTGDYHCHRGGSASQSRSKPSYGALSSSGGVAFRNCAAARAAGAAPVRRGDPGYGSHLDRDNDGIGCE